MFIEIKEWGRINGDRQKVDKVLKDWGFCPMYNGKEVMDDSYIYQEYLNEKDAKRGKITTTVEIKSGVVNLLHVQGIYVLFSLFESGMLEIVDRDWAYNARYATPQGRQNRYWWRDNERKENWWKKVVKKIVEKCK